MYIVNDATSFVAARWSISTRHAHASEEARFEWLD
jgi:hypothetical protein